MIAFAHGMYVDDILWFAIPVGLAIYGMRWAERRARARTDAAEAGEDTDGEAGRTPPADPPSSD
jgi:hypothetical protein